MYGTPFSESLDTFQTWLSRYIHTHTVIIPTTPGEYKGQECSHPPLTNGNLSSKAMIQPRSQLVSKPRLNSKSSDTQYNDLSNKVSWVQFSETSLCMIPQCKAILNILIIYICTVSCICIYTHNTYSSFNLIVLVFE